MRFTTVLPIMALTAGLVSAAQNNNKGNGQNANGQNANANGQNANNGGNNGGNNANALALDANNVQKNSDATGLDASAEAGQAASLTDPANFINFCSGKTLTNGLQVQAGSCNGVTMGDIPASSKMISAVMINPKDGQNVQPNSDINFQVQIANLQAGTFTNPDTTYYAAPQQVNQAGTVIGHTHITVQDLGNDLNPTQPLDATKFSFFKGINDDGNGQGLLSAALAGGLAAGNYRVCSMTSASNHQPVLMPIAQRGAQDDCVRFTVSANGGGNNGGNANANGGNANANGGNANANANGQNANGQGGNAASTAAAAQSTGNAKANQGGNQGGNAGKANKGKGQRFGRPRKFSAREWVA